jgi:hypothetical protein
MTEAWEKEGLDLKRPSEANVLAYLETLLDEENRKRRRNGLEVLMTPSRGAVATHIKRLLTPTEILVGRTGRKHTRNKRGRGSTDIRALLVGELSEGDECKISFVASARKAGVWETLPTGEKEALEKLDRYIQDRFWILVLLDVASRMPLAWVVTETPNAQATLARRGQRSVRSQR